MTMTADILKSKKITMATLKSFIKNAKDLYVESVSSFDGMTDCVESVENRELRQISKDKAIGHGGVWCVGSSRDYFEFKETNTHFGIEVYNSCGSGILWTKK
jgi:hypothetical protein